MPSTLSALSQGTWRAVLAPCLSGLRLKQGLLCAQGEPSVFASEAKGMAGRAAEPRKGTKNARQIAGRDYEHSSTCQARRGHAVRAVSSPPPGFVTVEGPVFQLCFLGSALLAAMCCALWSMASVYEVRGCAEEALWCRMSL